MTNICVTCNQEMKKGYIYSDRYALKWIEESKDKGAILSPFIKGVKLTNIDKPKVICYYCEKCQMIYIDVKENELD